MNQDDFERLLRQSRPQADANFQKALEDKLVARLQERKIKMNGTLRIPLKTYDPQEKLYPFRQLSVTLAAAVMVVLLLAAIFYIRKPEGGETLPGAASQQSATPSPFATASSTPLPTCTLMTDSYPYYLTRPGETIESVAAIFDVPVGLILEVNCFPADVVLGERQIILIPVAERISDIPVLVPEENLPVPATIVPTALPPAGALKAVVVTLQDIPAGTIITEEMLTEVLWPVESAPDNSFGSRVELVGRTAGEDIEQWNFLQSDQIEQ
ncbi:MAG: SAF domain-containing protein [Anaerolineae bacterium]|nr:SAF domain-containing protein [Anaerolineae bacterium]